MRTLPGNRRDRLRAMLADLKMPGALEAVDGILAQADSGAATAGEAIEQLLDAQIALRNNRRLNTAMRASRLPAVKTLAQFDFAFQPSIKHEQIESLHELGFLGVRLRRPIDWTAAMGQFAILFEDRFPASAR